MKCIACGGKNVKVASYCMELDRTFYECSDCGKSFSDADKAKWDTWLKDTTLIQYKNGATISVTKVGG